MTTVKEDPFVTPPPSEKGSITPTPLEDKDVVVYDPITVPPLAERTKAFDTGYGPITDALCNLFRIRGKAHRSESLDEVATQPSVYDTPQAEFFQPRADWEVGHSSRATADCRTLTRSTQSSAGAGERNKWLSERLTLKSSAGSASCSLPSVSHIRSTR